MLPSAGSRVVQVVPDRGMQRGKKTRTMLHALSIARRWGSREEVFLSCRAGFTRDARVEGSRLGMLQSRQPTLTSLSSLSLSPVCLALLLRALVPPRPFNREQRHRELVLFIEL